MKRKALVAAMLLAAVALLLLVATQPLRAGPVAEGGPSWLYFLAPALAGLMLALALPGLRAWFRAAMAGVVAFGLCLLMTEWWIAADIASNGPLPWASEVRAAYTWVLGFPLAVCSGGVAAVGPWLVARLRRPA